MKKFIKSPEATALLDKIAEEFAIVKNPDYVFPPHELYPLPRKLKKPLSRISGVVMDMDGTTTTTETLCIHSLEYMVRKITNRMKRAEWEGLDNRADYPHIIGNSTTKHVEYLIDKYHRFIDRNALAQAYIYAVLWFMVHGQDANRKSEVINTLQNLGLGDLLKDPAVQDALRKGPPLTDEVIRRLVKVYQNNFKEINPISTVRACIDIYYQRYHDILARIKEGKAEEISGELLHLKSEHLIEPMPAIGIYLALLKGNLGEDLGNFTEILIEQCRVCDPDILKKINLKEIRDNLKIIGKYFERYPAKVGVVTSSIFYEADIVMGEVFRHLKSEIGDWPIDQAKRRKIAKHFENYTAYYDGVVTASDSSEIRLKPHRDLYSIALHRLGIPKEKFQEVIGFEDSESGTIAIRAAGIGMCIAVPFTETANHDFRAASYILNCGIPEVLLKYHGFLEIKEAANY